MGFKNKCTLLYNKSFLFLYLSVNILNLTRSKIKYNLIKLSDEKAVIENFFLCLKSNRSGKEVSFKMYSTKKLKIKLRRKKVKYLQLNHIYLFVNIFNWFSCFFRLLRFTKWKLCYEKHVFSKKKSIIIIFKKFYEKFQLSPCERSKWAKRTCVASKEV